MIKRITALLALTFLLTLAAAPSALAVTQARAKQIHMGFQHWECGNHNPRCHDLFPPKCTSHTGKIQWVCQSVVHMDPYGTWFFVETAISPSGWILHNYLGQVPLYESWAR